MLIKKVLVLLLFLFPTLSFSDGLGLYMLNDFDSDNGAYEVNYGYSPGVGLSYALTLGENQLFSYRLGLEYYKSRGQGTVYQYASDGNFSKEPTTTTVNAKRRTIAAVNTFEFGLYRSKNLRFWVGPQFTIMDVKEKVEYQINGFDMAIGPVVGLNYNMNENISLSLDTSVNIMDSGENLSVRAYVFWRFGEAFEVKPARGVANDMGEKLLYIKDLRDQGILTDKEYESKRKEIIERY